MRIQTNTYAFLKSSPSETIDGVNSKLYSYTKSFSGFVANLTTEEAQKLKGMEGVMSVFPNENKQLHTTKSWDFMGFPNN
ncbi:cucumisin, partial [Quercus suber]